MGATGHSMRALMKSALGTVVRAGSPKREDLPESLWRLHRDADGYLAINGLRLDGLLDRWGSPLHVLDLERLDENSADFLAVPPGASAGCEPFYSYKTNPVPAMLARLHAHGVGAEVISEYELWLALKLGVPPERIVFNGPGRTEEAFKIAIERGVLIHLNNREEIARVAKVAHAVGVKARVGIRVVTHAGWNGQFGESIDTGAAFESFRDAQRVPELDIVALQCHQGGEIASEPALKTLLEPVVALLARLQTRLGLTLKIVDLGGSLACPTVAQLEPRNVALNRMFGADLLPRAPEEVMTIRGYTGCIVSTVERGCREANLPRPRIFVEPGRSMTGNAQMLLCRVLNLRRASKHSPAHAVLDAGVNIAEPVRSRYHQIFPVCPADGRALRPYRLVGPICTPMDVLYHHWQLPQLRRGEPLAIMDSGAYFVPFSTSFSFPQPAILALEGTEERLVRRRETFEDMVRRDVAE